MKRIKKIIVLLLLIVGRNLFAQIPLNDATWQVAKLDSFNSYNSTDWCNTFCWGRAAGGKELLDSNNVIYQGGYLKLKTDILSPPVLYDSLYYDYSGAAIQSKFNFKYGYFEISAKFPVGWGYWPAFWTIGAGSTPSCIVPPNAGYYHEIDIVEISGRLSHDEDSIGNAYHWRDFSNCLRSHDGNNAGISGNITTERKYAVLWEPKRLSYYIDDQLVNSFYDTLYIPNHALSSILSIGIDGYYLPIGSTFPAYAEINYYKVSQLIPDCSTVENICNFNAATYTYKVKKSLTIGGSGCSNIINTSQNVNFWATDFVLIDEGTTINDNGSGSFSINITDCPN
jgi:beta-glucanase (GH16 family)